MGSSRVLRNIFIWLWERVAAKAARRQPLRAHDLTRNYWDWHSPGDCDTHLGLDRDGHCIPRWAAGCQCLDTVTRAGGQPGGRPGQSLQVSQAQLTQRTLHCTTVCDDSLIWLPSSFAVHSAASGCQCSSSSWLRSL